jgi:hypothetical protein
VLRTVFVAIDGKPAQVVQAPEALPVPVVDLSVVTPDAREKEAKRLASLESRRPFDLASGPLVRLTLMRISAEEHVILFAAHHIACDGWSMGILVGELSHLYAAFSQGESSPLDELRIQYGDFAQWQRQSVEGDVLASQLSYWKSELGGELPQIALPTDYPRPRTETLRGAIHTLILPKILTESLRDLSRRESVTMFMTLLTAFQNQLHRYTGQDDIVVGTDMASRSRVELEGLIGFFVNLLVIRSDVSGNPSYRQLLHTVRNKTLEAYAHQDVPFDKLVEELQPERHLNDTPLFQVLFVFQNTPSESIGIPDLMIHPIHVPVTTSKFDLALFVTEGEDRINLNWQFKTELFAPGTIRRMASHFETLLESIVSNPDRHIGELQMRAKSMGTSIGKVRAQGLDITDIQ